MVDRNRVEDQMDGMLSEFTGVDTTPAPEQKGLSYGQLLIDNIVGLDNGYDSFGEKLGRAFNDDEVGFLKQAGVSAWEGAKQFVSHPIQTTEEVVTDIKDSVVRLGSEDLDARLQRMYGVDYTQASDEQVNQAREAVFGDALEAANLIPAGGAALKLGRTIGKTGVAADVIGTTRALASGDLDFLGGTPTPLANTAGLSAQVSAAIPDAPVGVRPGQQPPRRGMNPIVLSNQTETGNLLDFYSPVANTINNLDFGKNGLRGETIINYLNKRAPNINKSELESYKLNLLPSERYTREEIQSFIPESNFSIKEVNDTRYNTIQRQRVKDGTDDYFVLTLQGTEDVPFSHFTNKDLAHTRGSFVTREDGSRTLLIEELQSDILQNVKDEATSFTNPAQAFLSDFERNFESLKSIGVDRQKVESLLESKVRGLMPDEEIVTRLYELFGEKPQSTRGDPFSHLSGLLANKLNRFNYSENDIEDLFWGGIDIDFQHDIQAAAIKNAKAGYTPDLFPVTSNSDVVSKLLLGLIAKAQTAGVDTITMPPLSRIAALRAGDFMENATGTGQFLADSAVSSAENALRPTYVDSFEKAITALNREFTATAGDTPIKTFTDKMRFTGSEFSRKGNDTVKVLDISNFPDLTGSSVRFAEGGMVDPKDNPVFRHHLENVRTGNSVKNEDGTVSTIRTVIMGDGENEYLIPTVWGGRILSDEEAFNKAMSTGIDWPKAPAGKAGIKYLEELDRQIHSGFAEGGLAMETQMNRLMAEGGLNDDGMRVDPVSGNEVPPGSMAEEVRDDIPAQLSGGEYVVPADVVRYYGVRFFEDLRGQAKEGLTEMEQDGRIGGEPAGMEQGPAGLSEEDMMMLQQIASQQQQGGYAEGGMVNQPFNEDALIDNIINVAKNNPDLMGKLNQRGVMLYEGGMVKPEGYADGGSVGSPTFNPADWGVVGGSYFGPSTSYQTPIENRTYRGPLGETITVRFQNGVALDPIPVGFVPESEYTARSSTGVSGPVDNSRDRDQPFMGTSTPSAPTTSTTPDDPYTYRGADWNNPYEAGMEALASTEGTFVNRMLAAGASLLGGPIAGGVTKGALIGNGLANARANLRILEEKGMTEEADKLRAEIEKRTKDMNFAQDGLMDMFASGDRIFENLMNQINGRTTVSPTGVRTTGRVVSAADQLKDVAGLAAAKAMTPAQVEAGKTYASKGDSRDDSWSGGQVASNQDKPAKTTSAQEARERAKAAADKLNKPLATGGRARGGLMGKANKT